MSCWDDWKPTSSYVSKLDLTLSSHKANRSPCNILPSSSKDHQYGSFTRSPDFVSPSKNYFRQGCSTKPKNPSGAHCSRLEVTLARKDARKVPMKCPACNSTYFPNRLQMPWRYSSSCKDTPGKQACVEQGGFAPDHRSKRNILEMQTSTKRVNSDFSSLGNSDINFAETPVSTPKLQSTWTSRLDVVLANNSPTSTSKKGQQYNVFTTCNSKPPCPNYKALYLSSCSLTVEPPQPKFKHGSSAQPVLLMPQDDSYNDYPAESQQDGFLMSEASSQHIRSPENYTKLHKESTKEAWNTPERLPRVSEITESPCVIPNVFYQESSPPTGCRTNVYPVLMPTKYKPSNITLVIGSPVASLPVQVIQECNQSPGPDLIILDGNRSISSGNLAPGFLLSVNPKVHSKQNPADNQRSSPMLGAHHAKYKPNEQSQCHTVMPRLQSAIERNPPVAVSIEAFGSRMGAVKISIFSSRDYGKNS